MSGAAVKKAEEERKKKAEPAPFAKLVEGQDETKKKAPTPFQSGGNVFGDELMTAAPTMEQQARISHEAGVKKELAGLKSAGERKKRRKHGQQGGKVKQEGN